MEGPRRDLRRGPLRTAGERAQERKSVGNREHAVRRHAQPPCLPVYPIVVGDKVVNRIRHESSEKEVIGPIVTLRLHHAKNAFNTFDAGWMSQLLVLVKQYLTGKPTRRVSVRCEFPDCCRVDQEMEAKLGSALHDLHCERSVSLQARWTRRFQGDQYVGVKEKPLHRFPFLPLPRRDGAPQDPDRIRPDHVIASLSRHQSADLRCGLRYCRPDLQSASPSTQRSTPTRRPAPSRRRLGSGSRRAPPPVRAPVPKRAQAANAIGS